MSTLTEKQETSLDEAEKRVEAMTGESLVRWHIEYQPETRPGRGHDISAWGLTDRYLATQFLDPYGNGSLVVSEYNVIHNDGDDDHFDDEGNCECEPA